MLTALQSDVSPALQIKYSSHIALSDRAWHLLDMAMSAKGSLAPVSSLYLNGEGSAENGICSLHSCIHSRTDPSAWGPFVNISVRTQKMLYMYVYCCQTFATASLQSCFHSNYLGCRIEFTSKGRIMLMLMLLWMLNMGANSVCAEEERSCLPLLERPHKNNFLNIWLRAARHLIVRIEAGCFIINKITFLNFRLIILTPVTTCLIYNVG